MLVLISLALFLQWYNGLITPQVQSSMIERRTVWAYTTDCDDRGSSVLCHCLECMGSFNTHLFHSQQCFLSTLVHLKLVVEHAEDHVEHCVHMFNMTTLHSAFRHPGTYPKNLVGFLGAPTKKPTQKKPTLLT